MNKDIYNPKQKRGCLASIGIFFLTLFVSNIIFQIVFWVGVIAYISLTGKVEDMDKIANNSISYKELPYMVSIMKFYLIGTLFVPILTFIITFIFRYKRFKNTEIFGNARFSKLDELLSQGLVGEGIVFGKVDNKLICKPPTKEGHTLVIGGTGTGKSRGVVLPTLFKWNGSALVVDIKGEISAITSEYRLNKKGSRIYTFYPEGDGAKYNPIALCNTIDNAQELARTLIPLPESGEAFWSQSAQAILSAYVYEGAIKGYYLSDISEKLCTTPINDLINHCRESEIREVRLLCSIAYDMPEKTLGGVMAELKSKLITIATDSNIHRATSGSDWTPATLENNSTIYLRVSEHLLEQYRDLWTVILNQVLRYLSTRSEGKRPVLLTLDEMPRLGKIEGLTGALATLRSRNVHILGVIQSMAQLDEIYEETNRKIIADNCSYKLVLSATDPDTQEYFSKLSGTSTVYSQNISNKDNKISYNQTEVKLIKPEEWARLRKPILFAPRLQPTEIDLAFWDKEGFSNI
ncbi:type IV secretory system conjugative DNA transfer family protein [Campylobacter lari]|nr:type IV secretory system conjugative DNA transfer family protein [Campylobacter lari]